MEKEFVPYEIALQLKELGFDEPCFGIWIGRGSKYDVMYVAKQEDAWMAEQNDGILAPTFSQAFKFIREKYNLIGLVEGGYDNGKNIFTYVIWEGFKDIITDDYFETLEEAEFICLNELIKMVKENGK